MIYFPKYLVLLHLDNYWRNIHPFKKFVNFNFCEVVSQLVLQVLVMLNNYHVE